VGIATGSPIAALYGEAQYKKVSLDAMQELSIHGAVQL